MSPHSNPSHHKALEDQDILLGSSNTKPREHKDELSEQLDEIMNADSKEEQQTTSLAHERNEQPQDGPDLGEGSSITSSQHEPHAKPDVGEFWSQPFELAP